MERIDKSHELYGKGYFNINLHYIDEHSVSEFYELCKRNNIIKIQTNDEIILDPMYLFYQMYQGLAIDLYYDERDDVNYINQMQKKGVEIPYPEIIKKELTISTNGHVGFVMKMGGVSSNRMGNTSKNILDVNMDDLNPYIASYHLDNMDVESDIDVDTIVNAMLEC